MVYFYHLSHLLFALIEMKMPDKKDENLFNVDVCHLHHTYIVDNADVRMTMTFTYLMCWKRLLQKQNKVFCHVTMTACVIIYCLPLETILKK